MSHVWRAVRRFACIVLGIGCPPAARPSPEDIDRALDTMHRAQDEALEAVRRAEAILSRPYRRRP